LAFSVISKERSDRIIDNFNLIYEHDQYKWISPGEIKELETVDKIKKFIEKL
jgi:hypothetical protein